MPGQKRNFRIFKEKVRITKSLLNDAQMLIPLNKLYEATSLLDSVVKMLPTREEIEAARKEAPLRMALRGENKRTSRSKQYLRIEQDLRSDIAQLKRAEYSRRRNASRVAA